MENESQSSAVYDASSISVLKGLEAVRLRPGMYIGDTGKRGLHHLIWEVVDNSVDEAMAGHCTQVSVTIEADGETVTVEDNGRGIPVEIHPEAGLSTLEVVLCTLHAGGKFGGSGYEASGGLHGVGAACVNALSATLTARVFRDGGAHEQTFHRGVPAAPCERTGNSGKRGTAITWTADPEIFTGGTALDEETVLPRLRQSAYLNAGLTIVYSNKRTGTKEVIRKDLGIKNYVEDLNAGRASLYPAEPFYAETKSGKVVVQVAFQYGYDDNEAILAFANNIHTPDGGTHVSGFKTALTRVVNGFARSSGLLKEKAVNLSGDDIREGITAVISVRLPQPQFEGQTKAKLGSVEVDGIVNSAFGEALTEFFEKTPAVAKMIVERAQLAQQARDEAKKISAEVKRKSFLGKGNRLPGKLKDCDSEDREQTELFICEGDSAAGSAKNGRNPSTQAVLPIRGKIINANKNSLSDLLNNQEVQSLIAAIGTGITTNFDQDAYERLKTLIDNPNPDLSLEGAKGLDGFQHDEFNLGNLRYGKTILLCDADDDGAHIQALLLTFFFVFMRPLLVTGRIYKPEPPLFRLDVGKHREYLFSKAEMQTAMKKYGDKARIIRFKGLGEMGGDELGSTTMNPATRRLTRVTIHDMAEAHRMLNTLMGRDVSVRKAHIVARSAERAESAD